jgi:hypothetical protein
MRGSTRDTKPYSMAYFSAKHLGAGQYYLMTTKDKDGKAFDGGSTYRLRAPSVIRPHAEIAATRHAKRAVCLSQAPSPILPICCSSTRPLSTRAIASYR